MSRPARRKAAPPAAGAPAAGTPAAGTPAAGTPPPLSPFQQFVASESFGGILLVAVAIAAFAWANSPWAHAYQAMKELQVGIGVGGWRLQKDLIHWVNDGLMAIFFLYVGLEIKRELIVGELSDRRAAALPAIAAVGGMVVPALVYAAFNAGGPGAHGWGIPMATDIAFALGIMALLGDRVPLGLKVFLTALAIVDDLGAVLVIALFYTAELDVAALVMAAAVWGLAFAYKKVGGRRLPIFVPLAVVMWYFMLKSGIHATVAGVVFAITIPLRRALSPAELRQELESLFARGGDFERHESEVEYLEDLLNRAQSPLHELEHSLTPWVAFAIMPIFALFNAGFTLSADASLAVPVALGAFLGLLIGKLIGILGFSWIAVRSGLATLPRDADWTAMAGASVLAGIGFTMSLFIAALAFEPQDLLDQAKLGVLSASVVAAISGLALLRWSLGGKPSR